MTALTGVDSIEPEIVAALREVGASVVHLWQASKAGAPDLIVAWSGQVHLLEVKSPTGRLSKEQREFHAMWKAPIHIVRSVDEALRAIGAL